MQSTKEMAGILEIFAGDTSKLMYAVGDCHVTALGGRSRMVGTLLGKGYSLEEALEQLKGQTLESVVIAKRLGCAVKTLAAASKVDANQFPLLMHVHDLLEGKDKVNIPWEKFEIIL